MPQGGSVHTLSRGDTAMFLTLYNTLYCNIMLYIYIVQIINYKIYILFRFSFLNIPKLIWGFNKYEETGKVKNIGITFLSHYSFD